MSRFNTHRDAGDRDLRRLGGRCPGVFIELVHAERVPWHESPAERRRNERRARENERRLAWVRAHMTLELSSVERESIELYYLRGLTYRAAGTLMGRHASTVMRAANRGIAKLKRAAEASDYL